MTLVITRSGRLNGSRERGVNVWRGIPYAAAPVGRLRFRAPQPPLAWSGLRDATAFGASAPQPSSVAEEVLGLFGRVPSSEDCLFLNIWSRGPGGPPRPVLVWVHGGSFLNGAGSDPLYDGRTFAARGDVVVVTVNYRLGPLGFLHLGGDGGADDNAGLRDIVAALAWVRDNIAAFGGDPGCVTLFGQSAGAMAIGALLGVPAARGLFHRAILQSGAARHVHDRASAERVRRAVLRAAGLGGGDGDALRALPAERLVGAAVGVAGGVSLTGLPFQPLVDGVFLPASPLDTVRSGGAAGVPLLLGTTRDELGLYAVMAARDPSNEVSKRWRRLRAMGGLAAMLGPLRLMRIAAAYRGEPGGQLAMAGDLVFRQPALDLAAAQAAHAPVFLYRFDWASPAYGGALGAAHAVEVPFVWNTLALPQAALVARDGPAERCLADAMQDAWIAFARTGAPVALTLPPWPAYEPGARATMILDTEPRVESDPGRVRRLAWG